jgi:NTP pyrophosphatase (non-canonical NTP hydrolase)
MHIREFQSMMRRLYFHRDSERGITGAFDWLVDEVRELGDALKEKNKAELEKEFADVIAWLASLANLTDVDLETAATTKYDDKCPKCRQTPCECKF